MVEAVAVRRKRAGSPPTQNPKRPMQVMVSDSLRRELERMADAENISLSCAARELMERGLGAKEAR
jgi:hypothetical protein